MCRVKGFDLVFIILTLISLSHSLRQTAAQPRKGGGRVCLQSAAEREQGLSLLWTEASGNVYLTGKYWRCRILQSLKVRKLRATQTVHLSAPKCFCTKGSHWVWSTRPPSGWSKKEAWATISSSSEATVTARLAFSLSRGGQKTQRLWIYRGRHSASNNNVKSCKYLKLHEDSLGQNDRSAVSGVTAKKQISRSFILEFL